MKIVEWLLITDCAIAFELSSWSHYILVSDSSQYQWRSDGIQNIWGIIYPQPVSNSTISTIRATLGVLKRRGHRICRGSFQAGWNFCNVCVWQMIKQSNWRWLLLCESLMSMTFYHKDPTRALSLCRTLGISGPCQYCVGPNYVS